MQNCCNSNLKTLSFVIIFDTLVLGIVQLMAS